MSLPPKKILICGGHLTPALAVIEKLLKKKTFKIYYVGRKTALEGDKTLSLEYLTIKKLHIYFYSLNCARLQRVFTLHTIPSLLKFPISLFHSIFILISLRPNIVLSFGGYVSLPISIMAWVLRIPVVTHEQTHILGITNRIISRFSKFVCLTWLDTQYIPKRAIIVVTGNPIREKILSSTFKKTSFGDKNLPLIYITGGSTGSRSINQIMEKVIPFLVQRFRIVHQCGSAQMQKDFRTLLRVKNELPNALKKNYQVIKHIDVSAVGAILHEAVLVLARSGANTVSEIAAVGIPAIFIPLPWSADREQYYNTKILVEKNTSIVIAQEDATPEALLGAINRIIEKYTWYEKNAQDAKKIIPTDAADKIVEIIDKTVK